MRTNQGIGARTALLAALLVAMLPSWNAAGQLPDDVDPNLPATDAITETIPKDCAYEDQTGGTGGQGGACAFRCESGDFINAGARADDDDATVSATGKCGGENAHCSDRHACGASEGPSSGGGTGSCSGDSDEAWDSGFYLYCSASATPDDGGHGQDPWCPVTKPVPVCINPPYKICGKPAPELPPVIDRLVNLDVCDYGATLCLFPAIQTEANEWTTLFMYAYDGYSYGWGFAEDGSCAPLMPTCMPDLVAGRLECVIGTESQTAA